MKKEKVEKKVVVALSGGIDSAVAALILKNLNYRVIGLHLKLLGGRKGKYVEKKARAVAKKLEIPLKAYDARSYFQKKVIREFLKYIKKGLTPNPCVVCNEAVKFKLLLRYRRLLNADFVATGHYARIKKSLYSAGLKERCLGLFSALDKSKDQSYFLYRIGERALKQVLFPLGGMKKTEAAKIAKKNHIRFAEKESQDICFASLGIANFIKKYLKEKKGNVYNEKREFVGFHKGVHLYTIGQRKGLSLSSDKPYYVVDKNIAKNEIFVSQSRFDKKLTRRSVSIKNISWVCNCPKSKEKIQVQVRYQSEKVNGRIIKIKHDLLELKLEKEVWAATPGQSAVIWKGNEILGGGIII